MKHHKTILLADNSDEFRWLMWKSAKEHSYFSMMTVGSGRDVLLSVQKQVPDILLMDVALPDICGLMVLEELQRQGFTPKTIILSSVVSERVARKALDLGALYFIPKPFHVGTLFDMIHRLMHNHPQKPPLSSATVLGSQQQEYIISDRQMPLLYQKNASLRQIMKCPQKDRQYFKVKVVQAAERACCL